MSGQLPIVSDFVREVTDFVVSVPCPVHEFAAAKVTTFVVSGFCFVWDFDCQCLCIRPQHLLRVHVNRPSSRYSVNCIVTFVLRDVSVEHRPANHPAFGGTVPLFYQMSRVPLNHGMSRFLYEVGFFLFLRARNL